MRCGVVGLVLLSCVLGVEGGFGPSKVINLSGYETVNNTRNLFYWFFESRGTPETDPFLLWMTGGPGCSGMLALLAENGPYKVNPDLSLKMNPYSWNTKANVLWIDQPVGAGFSYDSSPIDPGVITEGEMAENVYEFFQKFFTKHPKYSKLDFYVAAESYGGHYGPAFSAYIVRHNTPQFSINLKGLLVGDGLVDPYVQYQWYAKYAVDNKVVNEAEYTIMEAAVLPCVELIKNCALNSTIGWSVCLNAYVVCNYGQIVPVELTGINLYDIREECKVPPLCYNFTAEHAFLDAAATKKGLGVPSFLSWRMCNRLTEMKLVFAGDWMLNYAQDVALLLEKDIPVLIYHGDQDYICNWYGGIHWAKELPWSGKTSFNHAQNTTWTVDGKEAGTYITYKGFTFLRVNQAGHMVPHDQPKNALDMLNNFFAHALP